MTTAVILLAGRMVVTQRLRDQIVGSRIIAADGGIAHAEALGVVPDLWIGDFDSVTEAQCARYEDVPKLSFPAAKDMSDGALAVREAIDGGASSICLVGAFGGRADHSLAVLLSMFAAQFGGLTVCATSGDEEALPLTTEPVMPDWPVGTTFSILPVTALEGLTIKGVQWPLSNRNVALGDTLTLSNVVTGELHIDVRSGKALAIAQFN